MSLLTPTNGATFAVGDLVTIEATADDPGGSVEYVDIFIMPDIGLFARLPAAPYTTDWPADSAGERTITAVARDNSGLMTTSAPVVIQIIANDLAVAIANPTNSQVVVGESVVVQAQYAVGHEVPSLLFRFYVDGVQNGAVALNCASIPCTSGRISRPVINLTPGVHTLIVEASAAPLRTLSAPVQITVLPATVNVRWIGTTGGWLGAGNWTNHVPTMTNNAVINNGGTAQITSPSAVAANLHVGVSFSGYVAQSGGTLDVESAMVLGVEPGSLGEFTISGGAANSLDLVVGSQGLGTFTQTDGDLTVFELVLGQGSLGKGTYRLGGGSIGADAETIGAAGSANFIHTSGDNLVAGFLLIGEGVSSSGDYELSGGVVSAGSLETRVGFVRQNGGALWVSGDALMGSAGTNVLSGGQFGVRNLILQNGMLDVANAAAQVFITNRLALYSGDHLRCVPGTTFRLTGLGLENRAQTPGDYAALGNLNLVIGNSANVTELEVASAAGDGFGDNFALGTLTLAGSRARLVNGFANSAVQEQEVFKALNLVMQPGSQLELNGFDLDLLNSTEGLEGEIRLAGKTLTARGDMQLGTAGSLTEGGQVAGDISNAGQINLATNYRTLTVTGNYSQTAAGRLTLKIGGTNNPAQRDQLAITGVASLGGTLTVQFTDGFAPAPGAVLPLLLCGSRSGEFATANLPVPPAGLLYQLQYQPTGVALEVVPDQPPVFSTPMPIIEADGTVRLEFLGQPGRPYTAHASTNLFDWMMLTNFVGSDVTILIYDPAARQDPKRFYRISSP